MGFSLLWLLLLQSMGSRLHRLQWLQLEGSVLWPTDLVALAACGIFLDQGSNPCPLHWQVESQPLDHQESPVWFFLSFFLASISLVKYSFCSLILFMSSLNCLSHCSLNFFTTAILNSLTVKLKYSLTLVSGELSLFLWYSVAVSLRFV